MIAFFSRFVKRPTHRARIAKKSHSSPNFEPVRSILWTVNGDSTYVLQVTP